MSAALPKEKGKFSVEVRGLTKTFGTLKALDQVSFQIQEGEIFVLLGPNGAGKTTLLKTLSTLLLPDQGETKIFGYDLVKESGKIKPLISLAVGEERSFYWRLTGRQNLKFFAALHNLSGRETREKIEELAQKFDLQDLDKRFDLYSTGMKQRFALARSFLKKDSRLILMDEPTRGLDPGAKIQLQQLILRMARESGRTFLITTHDTREAETLADHLGILDHGQLSLCVPSGESVEDLFLKITGGVSSHVL